MFSLPYADDTSTEEDTATLTDYDECQSLNGGEHHSAVRWSKAAAAGSGRRRWRHKRSSWSLAHSSSKATPNHYRHPHYNRSSLSRKNSYCSHASRWSYCSHRGGGGGPAVSASTYSVHATAAVSATDVMHAHPLLYRSASRSGLAAEDGGSEDVAAAADAAAAVSGGHFSSTLYPPASDDYLNASFPPDYLVSRSDKPLSSVICPLL